MIPSTRFLKWLVLVYFVLRLIFTCYSASVDAAQTRDYQFGFEPSANINLAWSHRQNIDMFHVQTHLRVRSYTIDESRSPLASIPYSPTNSHSNPRRPLDQPHETTQLWQTINSDDRPRPPRPPSRTHIHTLPLPIPMPSPLVTLPCFRVHSKAGSREVFVRLCILKKSNSKTQV